MHHLKLSSHQPYKVGLLLLQERNEGSLGTELGRGDSGGLASPLHFPGRTSRLDLSSEAPSIPRCPRSAYCFPSISKACINNGPQTLPV